MLWVLLALQIWVADESEKVRPDARPPAAAQSPSATLAPTGTLRGAFLGSNPVHGRVDAKTGLPSGPVPDLVRELARQGLPGQKRFE